MFSPAEREAPAERLGELGEQRLRQLHEVGVVGVRLVKLEHRELGVVLGRDPLVPEIAVDLVHALEPADDEPLEVELRRDPEVQVHVERVVVRLERPRNGAARDRLHHRCLDLQEAARVEEPPERRDEPRAEQEDRADVGVHDEVHVTLPIAGLHVLEAVPLLGQRPQRLREEAPRLDVDRELAGARAEHLARDADEVAQVEVGEAGIVVAEPVGARVELDPPRVVHEVREARLAVVAERHDPTREAHGLDPLQLLLAGAPQPLGERRRPVRHREAATERVEALRAQGLELLAPLAHEVVEVLAHQRAPPSAATGLTPGLPGTRAGRP